MKRKILNPMLVISGMASIISGLFIFFHLRSPDIRNIHIYGSLVFMGLCLAHIIFNWAALIKSMGGPKKSLIVGLIILALGSFMALGINKPRALSPRGGINRAGQ